jgi:threonine/homoserine efflux transporter RhtA
MADIRFTRPIYAIWAALCPAICIAIGATLALARPGGGDLVTALIWSAVAAVSSVFCAIKSVLLREPWRPLAFAGAVLGLIPFSIVLIALSHFWLMF